MLGPDGLYGHIRVNRWRSAILLAGFVGLIAVFWIAWCVLYAAVIDHWLFAPRRRYDPTIVEVIATGLGYAAARWWVPMVGAGIWFAIAYTYHGAMIRHATGARALERREAKALYNRVETLAIAAGLPMPAVQIMPTAALNAYAAGLTPDASVVAVTQGLLDTLAPDELDAVIAHELAHIKHRDVQVMTVAACFAGGLTLAGSAIAKWQGASSGSGDNPADLIWTTRRTASRREGPAVAVLAAIAVAVVCLALTHLFAILIQFALSRSREYLADAGAVELTRNPDALIRALQKISGRDHIDGLDATVAAMMISSSAQSWLATHPPIEARVEALCRHAGGRTAPATRPKRLVQPRAPHIVGARQKLAGGTAIAPNHAVPGAARGFLASTTAAPRRRRNFLMTGADARTRLT